MHLKPEGNWISTPPDADATSSGNDRGLCFTSKVAEPQLLEVHSPKNPNLNGQ